MVHSPSDRLICWDELTFFTLKEVLLVVGFCWFRLEILPVFVAPPWSEVCQSLSFAENCLAWKRGFNLQGSCLLIFEILFPSSILVDYESKLLQLSLPKELPSSPFLPRQTALDLDFDLPQIAVVGGQSVGKSLGINDEDADCVGLRKSAHEATKDRGVWLVVIVCVF